MILGKTRGRMVVLIIYVLSVGAMALHAQSGGMEVGHRDWGESLPDTEGKGLVLGTCTQCHSLNPVVYQRKEASAWGRTVRDMISRGAQIYPQEVDIITAYLARHFGPGAPPIEGIPLSKLQPQMRTVVSAPTKKDPALELPEGPAKALILRSCTECHGVDKITKQRKTEAGWSVSVKDMVRLGAKLRSEEAASVIAYLTKHYGQP